MRRHVVFSARFSARFSAGVLAGVLALSACSGGEEPVSEGSTPEEVLELARTTLTDTPGLNLSLTTDDLPDGVTGVVTASGVASSAPAFEGEVSVAIAGATPTVPIVAVDGVVYAQLPLTTSFQEIDPAEYGAPDPAQFLDPDSGFSSLLTETTDIEEGETVRGGSDNSEVLTEFTGTAPESAVSAVIPTASGDFDATYTITSDGELREAVLTGVFYPDSDAMTYTVGFEDYGTESDITSP